MSANASPPYILDFVFCVPGMAFDGETIRTKSLGGSESAGYYMARALAKRGHRVRMFSNCQARSTTDGVDYEPLVNWQPFMASSGADVHILQRHPELMTHRISAKLNLLWCHDLGLGRVAHVFRGAKWQTDR